MYLQVGGKKIKIWIKPMVNTYSCLEKIFDLIQLEVMMMEN